ncbi:hypothetical protein B0H11DRAFT_2009721 [Mycena galericulata]|nr:hypothetical protein B0H11DRAFT_2106337 [Mycena galericulata]KAJ7490240.1 hypothetical protein B0H11DRAFT_2009721 [Mycena galericulata]
MILIFLFWGWLRACAGPAENVPEVQGLTGESDAAPECPLWCRCRMFPPGHPSHYSLYRAIPSALSLHLLPPSAPFQNSFKQTLWR